MLDSADFPGLTAANHRITSPPDPAYNCVAWAVGDTDVWWWPDPMRLYYWPHGVPRQRTLAAFIQAFATLGYGPADNDHLEEGCEKLAIYATNGIPTHVARQLPDGRWTSKLGAQEDLEHDLVALSGSAYGIIAVLLKRPRRA